jgi:hypothetical protein
MAIKLGLGTRELAPSKRWRVNFSADDVEKAKAELRRERQLDRMAKPKDEDREARLEAKAQKWAAQYVEEGYSQEVAIRVARAAAHGMRHVVRDFPGLSPSLKAQVLEDSIRIGDGPTNPEPLYVKGIVDVMRGRSMSPEHRAKLLADPEPKPDPIEVKCACGREYTHLRWLRLPCVGIQDGIYGETWELRNCRCGSTISGPPRRGT